MTPIKSLEELKLMRERALENRQVKTASGVAQVIVGMGTCGIAAGARDTMKGILKYIETNNLSGIVITQTGCIGLCEQEPIVQVVIGDAPKVTYGRVSPSVAERIIQEHVLNGKPVENHVIQI